VYARFHLIEVAEIREQKVVASCGGAWTQQSLRKARNGNQATHVQAEYTRLPARARVRTLFLVVTIVAQQTRKQATSEEWVQRGPTALSPCWRPCHRRRYPHCRRRRRGGHHVALDVVRTARTSHATCRDSVVVLAAGMRG